MPPIRRPAGGWWAPSSQVSQRWSVRSSTAWSSCRSHGDQGRDHNDSKEGILIHRRKHIADPPPISPKTVRVLRGSHELEEAVERASALNGDMLRSSGVG